MLTVSAGFSVTPHAYGVDTTWEAVYENKQGGRTVGFNSEYDALPRIGHACVHAAIGQFMLICPR